jgi:Holliday junction resolvase
MNRYVKGARGERELLAKFADLGYSVVRSAGSGVNSISPDIIAIKDGRVYAFEC